MSGLTKDYLSYPNRGYGQDQGFYDWRLSQNRPKLEWKNGSKVAICLIVPLEFFPLNPSGVPFKHPGAMLTPYPDLRHFTVRDYGNRVGVYRILEALEAAKSKAVFAVNAQIAERYAPLMQHLAAHEILAHGVSTNHIHHEGLSSQEEEALIQATLGSLPSAKGWMSPARCQSSRSLELLAKSGMQYCLDWEMDQVPVMAKTDAGEIALIPNNYELSDFTLLHTRRQTEESWIKQIMSAIDLLAKEHERFGAQMLGLTLTPYIIGQPFRIWALRELLSRIAARDEVSIVTAAQINKDFGEQL